MVVDESSVGINSSETLNSGPKSVVSFAEDKGTVN